MSTSSLGGGSGAGASGGWVEVRVRPTRGWAGVDLRELWRARDLVLVLAGRDLKVRYKQTAIGVAWVLLLPVLGAGILTFVFGVIGGVGEDAGVPAFAVAFCGMVGFQAAFGKTLNKASACLVQNTHLVQKIYFPRLALPVSAALANVVDVAVAVAMLGVVMGATGAFAGWAVLLAPVFLALLLALGLGVGLALAALSVRFRDVQHITPVALQLLLFASPVGYPLASVREGLSGRLEPGAAAAVLGAYQLNPVTPLLEGLRWSTLGTAAPEPAFLAWAAAASVGALAGGALVFRRMERSFADVI